MLAVTSLFFSTLAFGWGERGHDLLTRIAARSLDVKEGANLSRILVEKEHMLGHYANVPDIVWRQNPDLSKVNPPTHFIDLEFFTTISQRTSAKHMPRSLEELKARIQANCSKDNKRPCAAPRRSMQQKISKTGLAPFRVEQLALLVEDGFRKIKKLQGNRFDERAAYVEEIDRTLVYMGLLSHFVADLANPNHTTMNYDGQLTGNHGIHAYFETIVMSSYPLGVDAEIMRYAASLNILSRLGVAKKSSYLDYAWALTVDSFGLNDKLFHLDRTYAQIGRAEFVGVSRKPASQVKEVFKPLIRERLAVGARTLAEIWTQAWIRGGRPHLKNYQSYNYNVKPEFIPAPYSDD